MKILISNDDGIDAPGIKALAKVLASVGEVTVVAPHRERSTASHSLTLHKPLRVYEVGPNQYSVSGSPADCVYLGLRFIMRERPDLIVSGINAGANLGTDLHYSGTVAAAREGALMNVRSLAFSLVNMVPLQTGVEAGPLRYDMAAEWAKKIVEQSTRIAIPDNTILNVNIPNLPPDSVRGIRVARQGFRYYEDKIDERVDPRGKPYYWIGGAYKGFREANDCDCDAVQAGFVSVTPITIDCTHEGFYQKLRSTVWE